MLVEPLWWTGTLIGGTIRMLFISPSSYDRAREVLALRCDRPEPWIAEIHVADVGTKQRIVLG